MTATQRAEVLPRSLPPRLLNREQTSAYCCVSTSLFDEMVKDGRMPKPLRINARTVWDRRKVDRAIDRLAGNDDEDTDDEWDFEV